MNHDDDFIENPEQSLDTVEPGRKAKQSELGAVRRLAAELIEELARVPEGDLVGQIIENAMKLLRDQTNRGDIKLINKASREIRYALRIFAPYRQVHKVSIFGSARTPEDHPDYVQCAQFARRIADLGWMVITGAGGGIMAAGHGGAGADPSFGLAIRLPFEQDTNIHIRHDPKLINFKYFFTRKLMFVRAAHAFAMFPGGFGTLDEGFEVLTLVQTGKSVPTPIVYVDHPGGSYWKEWMDYCEKHLLERGLISEMDLHLFKITDDVDEAIEEITRFYRNYHSVRTLRNQLLIRLQRGPTEEQLSVIRQQFADITTDGRFAVSGPHALESDEPDLAGLARLAFKYNRRDAGRLRQLIDHLNDLA
jgi:uncharacterized protein (TIGR00730 family)